MKNILFYKYEKIGNLEAFKEKNSKICKENNLLGTILIAEEGINGCLSGSEENLQMYMSWLKKDKKFSDIEFKITHAHNQNFTRLAVKIKKEIVKLSHDVSLEVKGKYVEPKELKKWLDSEEDILLVDVRNQYESKIGKFENALAMPLRTFRQLPSKLEILKNKNKKIVTYCTGGIRCEKASALLVENGFNNVYQLHGGIIKYGQECGNAHWQGKCFVFDTRGTIDIDPDNQTELISQCTLCRMPSASYHNCELVKCDKFFISCDNCLDILEGCCSKNCKGILKRTIEIPN